MSTCTCADFGLLYSCLLCCACGLVCNNNKTRMMETSVWMWVWYGVGGGDEVCLRPSHGRLF